MFKTHAARQYRAYLVAVLVVTVVQAAPNRYSYDELGRLVRVERADCTVITYTYDAAGNRLNRTVVVDADCDGVRNTLDCAPMDATAFAVPVEVTGLMIANDRETLTWNSAVPGAGSGTVHDVLRGSVRALPVGTGPGEVCLASGVSGAIATDAEVPALGGGFRYLVRGRNVCGVGTYGVASNGTPRTSAVCP